MSSNGVPEYSNGGTASGVSGYCAMPALPLEQMKQYMQYTQPALQSMKGSLTAATDIALASNGGTAFAKDYYGSSPSHAVAHLNDGSYGDGNGWIANSQSSFAGVTFNKAYTISSLAFGRDNTGTYADRYTGTYIFQYTTVANPNASTPDSSWTSFGAFYLDSTYPNTINSFRHVYTFAPISGVTGVRIEVSANSSGSANYIGIDELEVYAATPEPGTLSLLAAGLAGLLAYARRQRN